MMSISSQSAPPVLKTVSTPLGRCAPVRRVQDRAIVPYHRARVAIGHGNAVQYEVAAGLKPPRRASVDGAEDPTVPPVLPILPPCGRARIGIRKGDAPEGLARAAGLKRPAHTPVDGAQDRA